MAFLSSNKFHLFGWFVIATILKGVGCGCCRVCETCEAICMTEVALQTNDCEATEKHKTNRLRITCVITLRICSILIIAQRHIRTHAIDWRCMRGEWSPINNSHFPILILKDFAHRKDGICQKWICRNGCGVSCFWHSLPGFCPVEVLGYWRVRYQFHH